MTILLEPSPRGKYRVHRNKTVMKATGEYLVDLTKNTAKPGGTYRARTGPHCCNGGCGKRRR